jgi:serpin B
MKQLMILWFLFSLIACQNDPSPEFDGDPVVLEDVSALTRIHNDLAWDLLREETESKPHANVLISPYSIHNALSMLLNGADSGTLDEILSVMKCEGCDVTSVNIQHQKLRQILNEESEHTSVTISNGYFFDEKRIQVSEGFQTNLESYFDCVFRNENFDNPNQAKASINDWVKEQTNGKIEDIVDDISPDLIAFLINALHFKADWSRGFDSLLTNDHFFTQSDGQRIITPFLFDVRNMYAHREDQYFIADIPFKDSLFSLSLIGSSGIIPADFSSLIYGDLIKGMTYQSAGISFPKMTLEYKNSIKNTLRNLGMEMAFQPGEADFRKMGTSNGDVHIHDIVHKSVLEVNEKGAEGAAVTSVEFFSTELPPFFTFDKPYIFVLRHIPTETILFLGKVNEKPF